MLFTDPQNLEFLRFRFKQKFFPLKFNADYHFRILIKKNWLNSYDKCDKSKILNNMLCKMLGRTLLTLKNIMSFAKPRIQTFLGSGM